MLHSHQQLMCRKYLFLFLGIIAYINSFQPLRPVTVIGITQHWHNKELGWRKDARMQHTSVFLLSPDDEGNEEDSAFTQRQLLKEESEAPFRTIRIYFYIALLAAASISAFICATKLLAAYTVVSAAATDLTDLYSNLAVNLVGIPILAYLWKRDLNARQSKLERIQRGSSLAGLRLKIEQSDGPAVVKLVDLRRDRGIEKRVIIVAAKRELLVDSIKSSLKLGKDLLRNDLLVVPLLIDSTGKKSASDFDLNPVGLNDFKQEVHIEDDSSPSKEPNDIFSEHIGVPVFLPAWNDVMKKELSIALKQQPDALDKGITLVIKKNGKVGMRRFGVPIWEGLVEEVDFRRRNGLDITNI